MKGLGQEKKPNGQEKKPNLGQEKKQTCTYKCVCLRKKRFKHGHINMGTGINENVWT